MASKATLEQYNIPIFQDRPGVGQNLQDYLLFGPTWAMGAKTLSAFTNDSQLLTEAIVQ